MECLGLGILLPWFLAEANAKPFCKDVLKIGSEHVNRQSYKELDFGINNIENKPQLAKMSKIDQNGYRFWHYQVKFIK